MRLHHLAFRTRCLAELEAFYVELFELDVLRREPPRGVWLAAGQTVIMLELAAEHEPAPACGSRELVAFNVSESELAGLERELSRRQIPIEDRTRFTLYFRDPDGRRVGASCYRFAELESAV
jgi:catechol 2,3-dioxygenase-like lactoylglutathione lyase family enzyme